MTRKNEVNPFSKVASVFYGIVTFIYTLAFGIVFLGWIITAMTGVVIGPFGLLIVNAVFIIISVIMAGCVIILLHGTLVLRQPRREDKTLYYLYQAAGFSFAAIGLGVGILLNSTEMMGALLSIPYYGVMMIFPFFAGIAFGIKRRERPMNNE